ncbi:uncharacterized protein LOC130946168 [Arachis stenosperma]|uniref:uncharacterized protein LOC130946168 n=1 Tax=Arachis stenosperma TaxID=217475 RepID=UPI0025ABB05C|nr:uncharacterized protein LOC130946168 [Arachis stenosperma]
MEGLVPLVLRAIKKNRNRRQYECLDSSSLSYNITMAEIYHHHHHHAQSHVDHHHHHRRHKSVEDFGNGVVASSSISSPPPIPKQQQLMRLRSQRMFSCIPGS